LATRITELAGATLTDFTFVGLDTNELLVTRDDMTDFKVRVTRDRPSGAPANTSGATSLITIADVNVTNDTRWISSQGASTDEFVPNNGDPVSDIAEGVAEDLDGFAEIVAIADASTIILVETTGTAVTPTVTRSFVGTPPDYEIARGEVELDYTQTVTLEPAVSGVNTVTPGDRWLINFRDLSDISETANVDTNLSAIAGLLEGSLVDIDSSSQTGNVITFNRTGPGVHEIEAVEQRNRIAEVDGTGSITPVEDGREFYNAIEVTLAGNWRVGTVWTATIDGVDYQYTVAEESGRPNTLATVAFRLAEEINAALPGGAGALLSASAAGSTLTVTKSGGGGAPDEPFTFNISRSTGELEVLVDIDDSRIISGSQSFTTFRTQTIPGPAGLFGPIGPPVTVQVPIFDTINFVASPSVSLYRVVGDTPTLIAAEINRVGTDQGSNSVLDPFQEYLLDQTGDYALVIGSEITYSPFSNVFGVPRPAQFVDGVTGVARGQNYSAIVSIPGQTTNEDAISLAGTRLAIVDGAGTGQSGVIEVYDPRERLYVVSPLQPGGWPVPPDNSSFFNISETVAPVGYDDNIIRDEYTVVLSGAPVPQDGAIDPTVVIDILPERTRTYNSDEAFNPVLYFGEQQEAQVRVATQQAIIRSVESISSDWTVSLTRVGVGAVAETVTANNLTDLAAGIIGLGYSATVNGDQILITDDVSFFTGLDTGSAVSTYDGSRAEVELSGVIETGQTWSLELDGRNLDDSITVKNLEFRIVARSDDRSSLGTWVEDGDTFTYTVLANSGPRISGIAEAFRQIIDDNPFFADYDATRFGRILRISNEGGLGLTVGADGNGNIGIMPTRAEAVQQLLFTTGDWNIEQTVVVEALDDDFIDGGDALVFAPLEERINSVRGPITINGGFGQTDERFLNNPVMYPGETNEPLADGDLEEVGIVVVPELVSVTDTGRRAYIEDILTTHRSASTGLRPGFDPRMNDFPYTVEFLNGRAEGAVYEVLPEFGVSQDIFSIGNKPGLTAALSSGLLGSYFDARVTSTTVNTGITWSLLNYTFSGSADEQETWTIDLPGATGPYVVTMDTVVNDVEINTLGRVVFALQEQINADGVYNAEVRIGLLGEVNLLLSRQDGTSFTANINRSGGVAGTPIDSTVEEGGFVDSSVAVPAAVEFSSLAYFANRDADFSVLANASFSLELTYRDQPTVPGGLGALNPAVTVPITLDADPTLEEFLNALTEGVTAAGLAETLAPAISGRRVTFDSDWLVNEENGQSLRPLVGNDYYYAPFNANFAVDEIDQVDVLNIYNGDSPSHDVGVLTPDRLTGFGLGTDTVIGGREIEGGIQYVSLEEVNLELGSGDDRLTIEDTHTGRTTISTGSGDDRVAIANTSGTLTLSGDEGDDLVYLASGDTEGTVASDEGRLETILGHLTFDGGAGDDSLVANDVNDSSAETGTITGDALTGYGFGSVSSVQTLTVIGRSGFYRVSRGDVNVPWYYIRPGVARPGALGVALDVTFTADEVEQQLELIYGQGNVEVSLISEGNGERTYGIGFIGQLAGAEIAPLRWVDPGPINLVANGDLGSIDAGGINLPNPNSNRAEVITATRTVAEEDPSGGNNQQFLEIVNADRGTFTLTLLDQTTAPLPFDITLEAFTDALQPILNPNNTNPSKPFTNNFDILQFGSRFLVTFRGEHRDLRISGVDIDTTDLRGGEVILTDRDGGLSYFNLETFDLNLGDGANIVNVRSTTATTNLSLGGGNDEVYVSSMSDLDFVERSPSFIGNLDGILGTLNIDGGSGDQRIVISDASATAGDVVSITERLPARGIPGEDLSQLDRIAELFIIGASPAPISLKADQVEGTFRNGLLIETGSGDDTVTVTATIARNRIPAAAAMDLDTGLGNDDVYVALEEVGNSPLVVRTGGEFNYRLNLRSGLQIADLTDPEDEINVLVDGVPLSKDRFRAVLGQNALDLMIDGDLTEDTVIEVQLERVTRGRVSEVPGQREYAIDYELRAGESVELFSAGEQLRQGVDYFFYQVRPQQFILVFNGRFNFFRNGDIVWQATRIFSEFQTLASVGQRDDDFVNASLSGLPVTIETGSGNDVVIGGQNDDIIRSGRGNDLVFGRGGDDLITTVEDNQFTMDRDIVFGDDGLVSYEAIGGVVTIDSRNGSQTRLAPGDYRILEVRSVEGGSPGGDLIATGTGADILVGGPGSDELRAGLGNDIVVGDRGRVAYQTGRLDLAESLDSFNQGDTDDLLDGGGGMDVLIGGVGNDEILVGALATDQFSIILGDLGRAEYAHDPGSGLISFSGLTPTYPQLGGNDSITLSPGEHLVIAGGGVDEVEQASEALIEMELGRFAVTRSSVLEFFGWLSLASPQNLGSGTLITVDGSLIEEQAINLSSSSGNLREP
jgi:hypothetical protein